MAQNVEDSVAARAAAPAVWLSPLIRLALDWQKVLPRAALIFLPLALAALLVFYLLYSTQLAATQRVIAAGQNQLLQIGDAALSSSFSTIANDAQFISAEPILEKWLRSGDPSDLRILQTQYLSFATHRGVYDQIRLLGLDGKELVRIKTDGGKSVVVPEEQLQDQSSHDYVQQMLRLDQSDVYLSTFDLNTENGVIEQPIKPTIRVGAPVYDVAGRKRGIVMLNYLGQRVLDRVRNLSTQRLGEAWLVDARGYWLVGPSAADEWAFMYPDRKDRSFAHDYPAAWQQISAAGDTGQFSSDGDLFSYAAVTPPDGTMTAVDGSPTTTAPPGWYLVTRTPGSAYSQLGPIAARQYILALVAVLLVLAGISWTIAHHSTQRRQAERRVLELNEQLARDNATLEGVNRELESFSYSVSHDLRAPLRSIDGFSQALLEDYGDALDAGGRDYLMRVRNAAQRMGNLIDDLIKLARVTRSELTTETVNLSLLARRTLADLQRRNPERTVTVNVAPDVEVKGDSRLLQIAVENLLENAWKFTAKRPAAVIEFGQAAREGEPVYFVRDNGAGFDMAHAGKLFGVFQRLHAVSEFEGTGIGLATVQRIVYKHGGKVWGEAERDRGAAFFFTLRAGAKQHETDTSS